MKPFCNPIFIGSFPHTQALEISENLINLSNKFPLWAQLPNRSFLESMYVQYSEKMPAVKIDLSEKRIFFTSLKTQEKELQEFYENVVSENYDYFKISEEYANALYVFRELSDKIQQNNPIAIKGHITGPISFALTVTDENRRAVYFDPSFKEIVFTAVKMKAIWQINFLKNIYDKVILFVDEPYLSGIGSGIFAIEQNQVREELSEFVRDIKSVHPDVPIAFHCCGNTDWSVLINSGIDILSFDAFNYAESIFYYEDILKNYLANSGKLAWGIVPTSGDFKNSTLDSIIVRMNSVIETFDKKGFDISKLMENSFISPACGMGSLSIEETDKILGLTIGVSNHFKSVFSFV